MEQNFLGTTTSTPEYVLTPWRAREDVEKDGVNRIAFEDNLIRVGLWRCRPWHTQFKEDDRAAGHYIVFPHSSVSITPVGGQPIVADPNVVMFYNRDQRYRREKLSDRGDICNYFGFNPEAILETVAHYYPRAIDHPEKPFFITHGPSDPETFLLQRLLVDHVLKQSRPDPLYVQETSLYLLARVLHNSLGRRAETANDQNKNHKDLAHATKEILATHYDQSLTLDDLAARLYVSPYHLSRVFSQQVGQSLHQYRNQLRLRVGLDLVLTTDEDLASVGLSLGYSSHSHFTNAFHRLFGLTPSHLRRHPSKQRIEKLRKNLTV